MIDVEAVAEKYKGKVHYGGVVAEVNGCVEWLVCADEHGNTEWTPVGLMLEQADNTSPEGKRFRKARRLGDEL